MADQIQKITVEKVMTAYGTEFFSMNDVNRLRILQVVIDRRLTTSLAASLVTGN